MAKTSVNAAMIPSMSLASEDGDSPVPNGSLGSSPGFAAFKDPSPSNSNSPSNTPSISYGNSSQQQPNSRAESTQGTTRMDGDSDDEEAADVEPKFKYERLLSDRNDILFRDSATILAAHEKFLALGTKNGEVHVLDLMGNRSAISVPMPKHAGPVNAISISEDGDHMVTAGEDGKVYVTGLYSTDDNFVVKHSEPVKSVAICPSFKNSSPSSMKSVVFGSRELILCEKRFLGTKLSKLDSSPSRITALKWYGDMLAWGTATEVKVMLMKDRELIGILQKKKKELPFDVPNRCEIFWVDSTRLLVSWTNVFHICQIRNRKLASASSANSGGMVKLPDYELVINQLIETSFAICGMGPYVDGQFVVLAYSASAKDDQRRIQIRVMEPRWNHCDYPVKDIIGGLKSAPYASYDDYKLECLPCDGIFFIVSPKDIVKARPLEADELIDWLMERGLYEQALNVFGRDPNRRSKHNFQDIVRKYLEFLRTNNEFEKAAKVCPKLLFNDPSGWEEQIAEFYQAGKVTVLAPFIPRSTDSKISEAMYELVLAAYLQSDHEKLFQLLKEWPPTLYRVQVLINALSDSLMRNPSSSILLRCLGILYTHSKQLDKALAVYVKLRHADVFQLIFTHRLHRTIAEKNLVALLMEIDTEQALKVLVENIETIPVATVVNQLQGKPQFLLMYLDRLFQKDRLAAKEFHDIQVELYAQYEPKKLIHFMSNSRSYNMKKAFEICEKKDMIHEMVYLWSRMGNPKKALQLILNRLKDIQQAIAFCKDQSDPELWEMLINFSLDKPDFITVLLHNIGTHVDPSMLIRRIKLGLSIPDLRNSLVRILQDYNLQTTLHEGCRKIMVNDCYRLMDKALKLRRRGFMVDRESVCHVCKGAVLESEELVAGVTVFQCKHAFHTNCTLASGVGCPVCSRKTRSDNL